MNDYAPQAQYERAKMKPTADESKSRWTCFHDGKQYLLPVVARYQKIVPRFGDDGSVFMDVQQPNAVLAPLSNEFIELVDAYDSNEKALIFSGDELYAKFFGMVRRL